MNSCETILQALFHKSNNGSSKIKIKKKRKQKDQRKKREKKEQQIPKLHACMSDHLKTACMSEHDDNNSGMECPKCGLVYRDDSQIWIRCDKYH